MISAIVPAMSYSSVQYVKEAAKILGWDGINKDEKSRKFLSDLKLLSAEYNDHPYKMLCKTIDDFLEDDIHEWLFLHVREPGEIRRLVNAYPQIITVLITNKNIKQVTSNMADASVYHYYKYNETIANDDDLLTLQKKAEEFVIQHPESPIGMYLVKKYFIQKTEPDYAKAENLTAKMLEKQTKNGPLIILHRQVAQLRHGMVGTSMPRFSGPRMGGGNVSEADLGNDVAVLFAWGSWSFESQEMQRQLKRKERSAGGKLKCVGISVDADKTAVKRILERDTITSPVIFDGKLLEGTAFRQTGLSGVPDNIVYHHRRVVARGLPLNELMSKIDELLKKP